MSKTFRKRVVSPGTKPRRGTTTQRHAPPAAAARPRSWESLRCPAWRCLAPPWGRTWLARCWALSPCPCQSPACTQSYAHAYARPGSLHIVCQASCSIGQACAAYESRLQAREPATFSGTGRTWTLSLGA